MSQVKVNDRRGKKKSFHHVEGHSFFHKFKYFTGVTTQTEELKLTDTNWLASVEAFLPEQTGSDAPVTNLQAYT